MSNPERARLTKRDILDEFDNPLSSDEEDCVAVDMDDGEVDHVEEEIHLPDEEDAEMAPTAPSSPQDMSECDDEDNTPLVAKLPPGPFNVSQSAEDVTIRICELVAGTNRNITMDNWFTSIPLAEKLFEEKQLTIVAINASRIYKFNNMDTSMPRREFLDHLAWELIHPQIRKRLESSVLPTEMKIRARRILGIEEPRRQPIPQDKRDKTEILPCRLENFLLAGGSSYLGTSMVLRWGECDDPAYCSKTRPVTSSVTSKPGNFPYSEQLRSYWVVDKQEFC
ncbi:hypothetical protein J6590_103267 [Homalodisca vitripennis]|nr:hypothetical protein J6590_103267 [Homalodisca vitripennis]